MPDVVRGAGPAGSAGWADAEVVPVGDEAVGLVYFGERYLIPRIARWASPDPLAIHAVDAGEALNAHHYVSGNLLQARDPLKSTDPARDVAEGASEVLESGIRELFHAPPDWQRVALRLVRRRLWMPHVV